MIGFGGIVAGGVLLGSMLGSLVDPVPRNLASGFDGATAAPYDPASFEPAPSYQFIEAGPAELAMPNAPDGYAPSWARDGTAWSYPELDFSPWTPESYPTLDEIEARMDAARAEEALAQAESEAVSADLPAPLPADPPLRESELAALY